MKKSEAREMYRKKRQQLAAAERSRLDDLMLILFQELQLPSIHYVLSYWPIEENNEPNTHLFNDHLEFRNPAIKFLYPRADFRNTEMQAIEVNADTAFQKNGRNIYEPLDGVVIDPAYIDMVFVPLLIVDEKGRRIGYGKGFYDKYLQRCRNGCFKIGFCYFEPIDEVEDARDFDVPLDLCITPNRIYVF